MRRATFVLAIMFAMCVGAVAQSFVAGHHTLDGLNVCDAPCNVVLPDNTLEDQFDFNYTWHDDHTPIVQVWRDERADNAVNVSQHAYTCETDSQCAHADEVRMSDDDQTEYILNLQGGITQLMERVDRLENIVRNGR